MTSDPEAVARTFQPEPGVVALLERASQAGVWCWHVESDRLEWSPQLAALVGPAGDVGAAAATDFDFVAVPWREGLMARVRACIARGQSFDCRVQIVNLAGRRLWARFLGQAVRADCGQVERVEGVVQVISPRVAAAGAVVTVDESGRFTYLNEEAERLLARPAPALLGRGIWALFQKTVQRQVEESVRGALAGSQGLELEALDARQNQWLELRGERFDSGLAVEIRDVSARRQSQEQLRLLEGSIARLNDIVIITEAGPFNEPGPRIVFVNDAFESRTGYTREQVLGRSPRLLQGPRTQRERLDQIRSALEQWQPVRVDLINYRKDGEPFWVDLDISPVWDKSRKLTHWVAVGRDVTERKAAEQKIRYLAFYDALTGLPNRQLLLDRLHATLEVRAGAAGGALMFIDLDNFKVLNDTLGHQKGDLLLQQVAERLRACVAQEDTVARLGGDEFVILLHPRARDDPAAAAAAAARVADRILHSLGEPYPLPGYLHHSTCSIGVTVFGAVQSPVSELLKQADLAMYQAKRAGRNTVCLFNPQMQAVASANAALAADLRQAWREDQFLLDYQPQVDSQGRVTGVEALLRWIHPQRGRVPPDQFIPTAEETSLILSIGRWVLDKACDQLALWARRADRRHLSIAVNVSARQFRDPQFVDEVIAAIARSGIEPSKLKLELTESLLADGIEVTVTKMVNLKAMGVALSLDDFGMGYSSLSYLKRLPLNQLKIDREFVKDLLTDENDAAIARTIIGLAQSLRLDVIAEGVENQAQREFLVSHGCEAFQGHLFCQPLPIAELELFLDLQDKVGPMFAHRP